MGMLTMSWSTNSSPITLNPFLPPYIVVNPMLAKGFDKSVTQAVIKSNSGAVFILQSYLTTDTKGEPTFPGSTTARGEDPICNYLYVATTNDDGDNVIPDGW